VAISGLPGRRFALVTFKPIAETLNTRSRLRHTAMASPLSVLKSTMYSMHAYPPAPLSTTSSASSGAGDAGSATHELLARQLSVQMDYCNDLLGQVQKLEEQQLASQRAISEKSGQLRQALAITEAARGEAADAKRKLALAQVSAAAPGTAS
jgi:hypothetical protein